MKLTKIYTVLLCFLLPAVSLAQSETTNAGDGVSLINPLGNKTITQFLQDLLSVVMIFAVPLIVFMVIYAGFLYVTAQGNEIHVKNAHRALLYAVIGGVIILGAQAILTVIQGTVDAFK